MLADVWLISFVHQTGLGQIALLLGLLLGQDVTLEGVLTLDLTSTGQLKSLLSAGFGFHFWHCCTIYIPL